MGYMGGAACAAPAPPIARPFRRSSRRDLPRRRSTSSSLVTSHNAGIRIADVRTAVAGGHDTCAYLAAGHDCS